MPLDEADFQALDRIGNHLEDCNDSLERIGDFLLEIAQAQEKIVELMKQKNTEGK